MSWMFAHWILEFRFQVWSTTFANKLAVRPETQHKQCGVCIRHKAIMRLLGSDRNGRDSQMKQFSLHLRKQYMDRCVYWALRSQSRLKELLPNGTRVISMIVDGLDHSKVKFPRSQLIQCSKDMQGFQRPNMDLVACLIHGHGVLLTLTLPHVAKDSNLTADILHHAVHRVIESGVDARLVDLHLQADNTTRETKNNCTLRALASLVATHRLKRGQLSCLRTGHSHEDVDQYFSCISDAIQKHRELHHPQAFIDMFTEMHQDRQVRPNEPFRHIQLVSSVREWNLLFTFRTNIFIFC